MLATLKTLKFATLQHYISIVVFLAGALAAVLGALYGLPAGTTPAAAAMILLPLVLLGYNNVRTFFQNPPQDPSQAIAQGEAILGGKAGQRGLVRVGALLGLLVLAVVVVVAARVVDVAPRHADVRKPVAVEMAAAGEGCGWEQQNQTQIITQADADLSCIFGQVASGDTNVGAIGVACGIAAGSQVLQDLASLWAFYAAQIADGGAVAASDQVCGFGTAPFKHAPSCISAGAFGYLRAATGH